MNAFLVELSPKKSEFDPLARTVRSELLERGCAAKDADVVTERLVRIFGDFNASQIHEICEKLLVDPIVENFSVQGIESERNKKSKGVILDVWPKAGVTDPMGESVVKGLKDLGFKGDITAVTAQRYIFPKLTDSKIIKDMAQQSLANALIHDIHIEH